MTSQPGEEAQRIAWALAQRPFNGNWIDSVKGASWASFRVLNLSPSIPKLIFGTIRVLSPVLISLLPVMLKSWKGDDIMVQGQAVTWPAVILITGAIVVLLLFNRLYDLISAFKRDKSNVQVREQRLALSLSNATKRIAKAFKPDEGKSTAPDMEPIRNQILVGI